MTNIRDIENSEGYKKLLKAVEHDEKNSRGFHDYRAKLDWVIERANHYAENTGLEPSAILDAWEDARDYWYMNYYQDSQQPKILSNHVKVYDTLAALKASIDNKGFRCPRCNGVSKSPYECDSGLEMEPGEVCNWKSFGVFGTMGKGVFAFVKSEIKGNNIFMPIAWETEDDAEIK